MMNKAERKAWRAFIRRNIRIDSNTGCWEWQAGRMPAGYGLVGKNISGLRYAHQVAYQAFIGPLKGLLVCHECDNPPCCNPKHLWLGTHSDNTLDSIQKGRRKHVRPACGEAQGLSVLTSEAVREIRQLYCSTKYKQIDLAKLFGVSRSTLRAAIFGETWKHVPGAVRKGTKYAREGRGEANGHARLCEADIKAIRASNETIRQLAEQYGISASNMRRIVLRESWTHVG